MDPTTLYFTREQFEILPWRSSIKGKPVACQLYKEDDGSVALPLFDDYENNRYPNKWRHYHVRIIGTKLIDDYIFEESISEEIEINKRLRHE